MLECPSPQFWSVILKRTNSNEFQLIFNFQSEIFVKRIIKNQNLDLYQSCSMLEKKGHFKWDFQKFSFMSFHKDVDFNQMLKSQINFHS